VSDSDEALLERLRSGDDAAFETLFLRHYARVFRVLRNLVEEHQQAEDLAQETFLALFQHPPRLDAGTALPAWLCRVAINRGYNALRSGRRARQRLERAAEPEAHVDPDAELLRSEERSKVRTTLASLPERQAKLLLLRHAGLSYAEVAAVLDVAPGSIGTLLVRAERAFLQLYEQVVVAGSDD
jgi:RNA polymerase sigma-70 factor, ECF subfamily